MHHLLLHSNQSSSTHSGSKRNYTGIRHTKSHYTETGKQICLQQMPKARIIIQHT